MDELEIKLERCTSAIEDQLWIQKCLSIDNIMKYIPAKIFIQRQKMTYAISGIREINRRQYFCNLKVMQYGYMYTTDASQTTDTTWSDAIWAYLNLGHLPSGHLPLKKLRLIFQNDFFSGL